VGLYVPHTTSTKETPMNLSDRVFLMLLVTLFLLVWLIERRNMWRKVPAHVVPPKGSDLLLERINVPKHRDHAMTLDDVAYMDVSDAASAGNEPNV
jgi:hypothetical protein